MGTVIVEELPTRASVVLERHVIVAIGIDRIRPRPTCTPSGTGAFVVELPTIDVDERRAEARR